MTWLPPMLSYSIVVRPKRFPTSAPAPRSVATIIDSGSSSSHRIPRPRWAHSGPGSPHSRRSWWPPTTPTRRIGSSSFETKPMPPRSTRRWRICCRASIGWRAPHLPLPGRTGSVSKSGRRRAGQPNATRPAPHSMTTSGWRSRCTSPVPTLTGRGSIHPRPSRRCRFRRILSAADHSGSRGRRNRLNAMAQSTKGQPRWRISRLPVYARHNAAHHNAAQR